jgi:hypothetical protein
VQRTANCVLTGCRLSPYQLRSITTSNIYLYERPRPGKATLLDAQHRQRIVALVCGPPPEGRARWTVRLLTEEVVKRKLVPRVGRETIRVLLESHDLKPWREKMWCVAELDEEYIRRMEAGQPDRLRSQGHVLGHLPDRLPLG